MDCKIREKKVDADSSSCGRLEPFTAGTTCAWGVVWRYSDSTRICGAPVSGVEHSTKVSAHPPLPLHTLRTPDEPACRPVPPTPPFEPK